VTLRIVCVQGQGELRIQLHGRLSGPPIAELQAVCASPSLPLHIDLENVSGASAEGILALKELRASGASLSGASPYIELLLSSRPAGGERGRSDPGSVT
jgi:hypothetical protein